MKDRTDPLLPRELRETVAGSLESMRSAHGGLARVRERLRTGETPRFRQPLKLRQGRVIAIVTSLAVAAGAVLAIRHVLAEAPLAFRVERGQTVETGVVGAFIGAPKGAPVPLLFSDGTRIGLGPSARLRVAEVEARGASLILETGEAHVDVVHRANTRWRVDAGPFAVHVTGTTFDIAWDPAEEGLFVNMTSGSVVVTGCELGEGRRISAGEQLRMTCKYHEGQGTLTALEPAPAARLAASPGAPKATPAIAVTAEQRASSRATVTTPTPALLGIPEMPTIAPMGSGSAATAALAPRVAVAPSSEPSVDTATAGELLALGERARYAGNERAAVDAFTALRTRFPNTELAAAAAFELGRLAADNRHDFSGAAVLFDACVRERPTGNLAREAMGRALEAREHGGGTAHSAAVAADYLRLYPMGPHAALARRVLSRGADAGPLPDRADTGAP